MYLLYILSALVMVAADGLTKLAVLSHLKKMHTYPIIKDVLHLTYCENTGGAFSFMRGNPYLLAGISIVLIMAIVVYIAVKKPKNPLLMWALTMISAGGTGNIIDRIFRGFVVDFIDFRIINFAIFNVADIFVCVGMGLLVLYVLIEDKKEKTVIE